MKFVILSLSRFIYINLEFHGLHNYGWNQRAACKLHENWIKFIDFSGNSTLVVNKGFYDRMLLLAIVLTMLKLLSI